MDEPIRAVQDRLRASPYGMLVVQNTAGIVMGRLGAGSLDAPHDDPVSAHMREGPTTVRPAAERQDLLERMRGADVDVMIVTRSDGRLVGLFERAAQR